MHSNATPSDDGTVVAILNDAERERVQDALGEMFAELGGEIGRFEGSVVTASEIRATLVEVTEAAEQLAARLDAIAASPDRVIVDNQLREALRAQRMGVEIDIAELRFGIALDNAGRVKGTFFQKQLGVHRTGEHDREHLAGYEDMADAIDAILARAEDA